MPIQMGGLTPPSPIDGSIQQVSTTTTYELYDTMHYANLCSYYHYWQ
jgi:hypothetical protein